MIDYKAIPDEDLFVMCCEGDEGAWEYTYNYILAICRWKTWNLKAEAKEMAQQVTLHLMENAIKKVKERTKFRNFVTKMTINKIKDSFKSKWRKRVPIDKVYVDEDGEEFSQEIADPLPSHEKVLIDLEIVSVVDAAILKLPAPCRVIVREYLNFKMGLYQDYRELSRVLKMKIPTISSMARRCLNKLIALKEIRELMVD
ncbi:MAG: sigma-70 family RNA polymerase sigma factor [Deltaproteobacteria bacterium]|nr:sigma-70 family RNA polymerase sigma factor [Deltaproteobacteria bacterium]